MSYQPYPRSMYRLADRGFEYEGHHYAMLEVASEAEEKAAKGEGWRNSPAEALDPHGVPSPPESKLAEAAKPRRKKAVSGDPS